MSRFQRVVVLCSIIGLLFACSDGMNESQHLAKAKEFIDKGELKAASIQLKNVLQQNPDNPFARLELGKLYLKLGNTAAAEKELERASELGAVDTAVLPLLARVFLVQGKHDELQEISLEKLVDKEQKADVLASQGLGKLAQRKTDWAAAKIDRALSLDPQSTYAGVAKARLLTSEKKYDLAQNELDRILELDGSYAPAWSLQGDLESLNKNLVEADASYTKAIKNQADNLSDFLKRAQVRLQQKKYKEAQKDIDVLKKLAPKHPGVNYAQGLIHYQNKRFSEAKDAFDLALRANKRHLQAAYYLSMTHLQLGNRQQAEEYGKRFLSAIPGSIPGRRLMAFIELGNKEYAAAEELIRPVVNFREDDIAALNLLADSLLKQNKTDEAIKWLEKVASLQSNAAISQLRLGVGLLAGQRHAEGVKHVEKAIRMDPQLQQAYLVLVSSYLKQKDLNKALDAAQVYRGRYPDIVAPYNLIGRLKLESGQEADAIQAFTRSREIAVGDPAANHALASLAIRNKDYPQARNYYQDVLEHNENHLTTLLKLVGLDALEKKQPAMLEHLQQAATAHPNAVLPIVMLARYYLSQGNPIKVTQLMIELSERQKNIPAVLEIMALYYLDQKQFKEAIYTLQRLVQQQSNSAKAHFLLARAYAGLGDRTALSGELETAIELDPKYFAAQLAFARLLLLEGKKERLSNQLVVINELSPGHPDVMELKVSLALVEGDQKTATGLLDDLFEKTPTTVNMLSVVRQKWAVGDMMGALELQEQWSEEHPEDLVAALALAASYAQEGQINKAIIQYQQVLAKDEKSVVALNDLAWFLRDKHPAKALEYAGRAKKLAPESAIVMKTLAAVLLKNGDIERAQRNIERALTKQPNNREFRYHSAMIDAASGDKVSAIKTLQSILDEERKFPGKAEAKQLLTELKAGAKTTP